MNAYLRTLPLPGAVRPVREHGASALDRAINAWPAPDPAARVLLPSGAPVGVDLTREAFAAWPEPDPATRFELPTPDLRRDAAPIDGRIPWTNLVEPRYPVPVPDLQSASRRATASPIEAARAPIWPPPTLDDAPPVERVDADRNGLSTRLVVGLAVAAGALAAGAAALTTLF